MHAWLRLPCECRDMVMGQPVVTYADRAAMSAALNAIQLDHVDGVWESAHGPGNMNVRWVVGTGSVAQVEWALHADPHSRQGVFEAAVKRASVPIMHAVLKSMVAYTYHIRMIAFCPDSCPTELVTLVTNWALGGRHVEEFSLMEAVIIRLLEHGLARSLQQLCVLMGPLAIREAIHSTWSGNWKYKSSTQWMDDHQQQAPCHCHVANIVDI